MVPMRCNSALTLAILAFSPWSSQAQAQSQAPAPIEIVTQEQHLWTTFSEGDFNTVHNLFTPDYIQVSDTIQALDTTMIFLKHCKLTSYDLQDLQVRILSPDSALTAYHVVSSFTCTPDAESDKTEIKNLNNNSLTVWIRRPGTTKWLVQAHTETPISHP